jgi:two-component system nitrogen regulation sensor histidine kinase NtrY
LIAYREAAQNRQRIQMIFALSYAETALLVFGGAVWLGMGAANTISAPVARLVQAAGRVAGGDLSARVDAESDPEEIAVLSRAFNSLDDDLQAQQKALRPPTRMRGRMTPVHRDGAGRVSAGVIGLWIPAGRISAATARRNVLDLGVRRGGDVNSRCGARSRRVGDQAARGAEPWP